MGMIEIVELAAEKSGGLVALASALGIRHQALYGWKRVPAERVLDIERITGISRHELRPDLSKIFISNEPSPSKEGEAA